MGYYFICLVILFFFLFLLIHRIVNDIGQHSYAKYIIPYCILLTLLFKYNWGFEFWGLEYEDAYSFSFCARQFSHNIYPTSFLIDAIAIGSLDEPSSLFTYGGHFITYPVFLSIFTRPLGWSPSLIFIINTIVSFIILLILSLIGRNNKFWFIAPSLYCVAPIINVFTTCCLSEIFSSLICLTFIYTYLKKQNNRDVTLCLISFGLALLCKRENMALLFIPIIDTLIKYLKTKQVATIRLGIQHVFPYILVAAIYILGCQNIFNIENIESEDIGQSTFSLTYFVILFPIFIKSLLSPSFFSISVYIYIGYILYVLLHKGKLHKVQLISILLISVYILLYTCHYRGWFFLNGEKIDEFESFRYINNFFYLFPIALCYFYAKRTKLIIILIIVSLSVSFYQTIEQRTSLAKIEQEERFNEVTMVVDYIENQEKASILICDNILVYQNKCNSDFFVCDITHINALKINPLKYTYYIILSEFDYIERRHGIKIDKTRLTPILRISENKYLYQYN